MTAPCDRVLDLVFDVRPGPVGPDNALLLHAAQGPAAMQLTGGPDQFEANVAGTGSVLHVTLLREERTFRVEGEWWYRGEYTFVPQGDDTLLTYRVFNLTRVPNLVIKLWQFPSLRRRQRSTDALAELLTARLDPSR